MINKQITVILVDDHAVVRAGFRMLLATEVGIEVIAEADRGEQAFQLYLEQQPDVLVMDLSMPGIGGLETIRRICKRDAQAKIVVFSVHDEMVYVQRALQAGAKGYITKQGHPDCLIAAIHKVAAGEVYLEPKLQQPPQNQAVSEYQLIVDAFSSREFDVFCLLAKGLTMHKIAEELCIGYKTAANYGTQIRSKLNVATGAELAHIAILIGVINQ